MNDIEPKPLTLALRFQGLWTAGNVEKALELLADDFVCHGPGGNYSKVD